MLKLSGDVMSERELLEEVFPIPVEVESDCNVVSDIEVV